MSRREILGYAVAACVACCVGPILGVLAPIAALGLASTILVGAVGAIAAAAAAFVLVRRRRKSSCSTAAEQTSVELSVTHP